MVETDFEFPPEIFQWYSATETRFQYQGSKPGLNFGIGIGVINFGFSFYAATLGGSLKFPKKLFSGSLTETIFQYRESKPGLNFGIGIGVIHFGFNFYAATLGGTLKFPEKLFRGSL